MPTISKHLTSRTFSIWSSWRSPLVTSLLSLPNELLDDVVSYLNPQETSSFIATCQRMSRVGEYRRYTSLIVGPKHGHRLVTSLLLGSEASNRYCKLVKRLWFRGWTYQRYTFETAVLFCHVLPFLDNLISLWIEVSPTDSVHLMKTMKRAGLLREKIHPAQCLIDIALKGSCFSARTLPNLRYLKLSGDVSLCQLASLRSLEEIEMNVTLNHEGFSMFISNAQDSLLGENLKALTIKLTQSVDASLAFPIIANAFPNLERLNLEQLGVKFEGMVEYLASAPGSLKDLSYMVVNCLYAHPLYDPTETPDISDARKMDTDVFMQMMQTTFDTRRSLRTLGLGQSVWVMGEFGSVRKRLVVQEGTRFWSRRFGSQTKSRLFSPYFIPAAYLASP